MADTQVAGLDVSRETFAKLKAFEGLVKKWNKAINLISRTTVGDAWERHVVDSAQIFEMAPKNFSNWVDLGSGGGFPGIVVGVLASERSPAAQITLIESDQRKATFLRTAARELEIPVIIRSNRIEDLPMQEADVISARALMPLEDMMSVLEKHLSTAGTAILHKGKRYSEEIAAARADWTFDLAEYPSMTDDEARILTIQRISRV